MAHQAMSRLGELLTGSLALEPGALAELVARGAVPALSGGDLPAWYRTGPVAVVVIGGTLMKGTGVAWAGLTGYDQVRAAFAAALADRETTSILLHIDSPGGQAVEAVLALPTRSTPRARSSPRSPWSRTSRPRPPI